MCDIPQAKNNPEHEQSRGRGIGDDGAFNAYLTQEMNRRVTEGKLAAGDSNTMCVV